MALFKARIDHGLWLVFSAAVSGVSVFLITRALWHGLEMIRPIPYWDQWEFVKSIPHIYDRTYSWADLFSQHNEHRIVTSRLVFIIDTIYFDATGYFSLFALYLSLISIVGLLAWISDTPDGSRLGVFLLMLGFMLSPAQWENFSSGFQVQFPFVDLFMIAGAACLVRMLDGQTRALRLFFLAAASFLDFLAVFSMASGVLTIVPATFIGLTMRSRLRLLLVYAGLHLAFCVLFFIGYHRSADIAPTYNPILLTQFAVVYMGSCLRGYTNAPFVLGVIDAFVLAYAVLRTLRSAWLDRVSLDRAQITLVAIAILIVAGAFLTANGRASLGDASPIQSRYALQSILLQLCLFIFCWRAAEGPHVSAGIPRLRRGILLVILLLLSVASHASRLSIEEWRDRVSTNDIAGSAFANGVFSDDIVKFVYPLPTLIDEPLHFLISRRLGPFSVRFGSSFRAPLNAVAGFDPNHAVNCMAQIGSSRIGPTWFQLEGWIYSEAMPAANGWVLALDTSDHDRIVGFGRQSVQRDDVDDEMHIKVGRTGFLLALNSPSLSLPEPHTFVVLLIPLRKGQPICIAKVGPGPAG